MTGKTTGAATAAASAAAEELASSRALKLGGAAGKCARDLAEWTSGYIQAVTDAAGISSLGCINKGCRWAGMRLPWQAQLLFHAVESAPSQQAPPPCLLHHHLVKVAVLCILPLLLCPVLVQAGICMGGGMVGHQAAVESAGWAGWGAPWGAPGSS